MTTFQSLTVAVVGLMGLAVLYLAGSLRRPIVFKLDPVDRRLLADLADAVNSAGASCYGLQGAVEKAQDPSGLPVNQDRTLGILADAINAGAHRLDVRMSRFHQELGRLSCNVEDLAIAIADHGAQDQEDQAEIRALAAGTLARSIHGPDTDPDHPGIR